MGMSDQYAVFGNPIEHSKSPLIHREFARQTAQKLEYKKQLVEIDQFTEAAKLFFEEGGQGLNITVPFKLEAFNFADQLTERATNAGAVNTLKMLPDGKILGDNTDGFGLVSDIVDHHQWPIKNKSVLVLGAGGAVRGILQPLLEQNPKQVVIANRTIAKAENLAAHFSSYGQTAACSFEQLSGQQFDVVVNGTSASLGGELPPLPPGLLTEDAVCYDMMYGASLTVFLQWAKEQGCQNLADGLGMLVGQAAESFYLWRGVRPDSKCVMQQLRDGL